MSAVVVQDLRAGRVKDYKFDWQRMLETDGETGEGLGSSSLEIL